MGEAYPLGRVQNNRDTRATRDLSLDILKGMLVVIMTAYHAMNIFSTAGPTAYAYIRFVSGSFLVVSGYVIATFYLERFLVDWRRTSTKLEMRGLKLLIIFTTLNILIRIIGFSNPDKSQIGIYEYIRNMFDIYVVGDRRYASFQILLPLSYLLFVAPVLLALSRVSTWAFFGSFALTFMPNLFGIEWISIGFTALGAMGFFGGILANAPEKPVNIENPWTALVLLATTIFFMGYLSFNAGAYALGTFAIVKLLHDLSKAIIPENSFAIGAILLGRHSLLCYILQIIFMQLLSTGLARPRWPLGYETILVTLLTVVMLLLVCIMVERLGRRYKFVDKVYKFVFS